MSRFLRYILRAPEGDGSGGAGSGAGDGKGKPDPAAELDAARAEIAALKAAAAKTPPAPKPEDDPGLVDRARLAREASEKEAGRTRQLENALKFGLKAPDFLKQNESLLPKEIADIFKQADKETFSDAIEKDGAIKSGLIQAFFAVQANVDLLTSGQKATLDDYLKLTKTGKQEKAQAIYDMVFEPAFETLKRVKRADALNKGHGSGDDDGYKKRLISGSQKHYFGENKNA